MSKSFALLALLYMQQCLSVKVIHPLGTFIAKILGVSKSFALLAHEYTYRHQCGCKFHSPSLFFYIDNSEGLNKSLSILALFYRQGFGRE